jgi:hypothetical protein
MLSKTDEALIREVLTLLRDKLNREAEPIVIGTFGLNETTQAMFNKMSNDIVKENERQKNK